MGEVTALSGRRAAKVVPEAKGRPGPKREPKADGQAPEQPRPRARAGDRWQRARLRLYRTIEAGLEGDLDEGMQRELARLLDIIERIGEPLLPKLLPEARIAVGALLQANPKVQLARGLRYRLEMQLLRNNGLLTRHLIGMTDGNPLLIVGLGLFITMLIGCGVHLALPALLMPPSPYLIEVLPLNDTAVLSIAEAAFLGGVVSILARLRAFSRLAEFDPVFLFFNALFKPAVGVIFGVFVYALWQSGLVPLDPATIPAEPTIYMLWTLGFLSGFSERFTQDIIARGEGIVATGAKKA